MANQKISQLTNGNPAVGTDQLPINRGGANFSLTAASIAALAGAAAPIAVTNGGTGQSTAGQYGLMIARTGTAVAQSTQAEAVVFTATVPGGLLTANGVVKVGISGKAGTITGAINWRVRIAASGSGLTGTVIANPNTSASNAQMGGEVTLVASQSVSVQTAYNMIHVASGVTNDTNASGAVNTAANWDIVVTLQMTNADASGIVFSSAYVIVYP